MMPTVGHRHTRTKSCPSAALSNWRVTEPGIPRSDAEDRQLGPLHGPKDYASRHNVYSRRHLAHELVPNTSDFQHGDEISHLHTTIYRF